MSGGEPSSIKQSPRCAARKPALSRRIGTRVFSEYDFKVYGLILQLDFFRRINYASGSVQKMASDNI